MNKVFITGAGIISCIGKDASETVDSILSMKSGIGDLTLFNSHLKGVVPVGEVRYSNNELRDIARIDRAPRLSRTTLLAAVAAREALGDVKLQAPDGESTGLISSTTVGGMLETEHFFQDYLPDRKKGRLREVAGHDCADSTESLAEILGVRRFFTTLSTACSSGANAIMFGARLIRNGILERVIAGGCDSLCKFTLNGFNSLLIVDRKGCRPFDDERQGLTLGEGAGYVMMESGQSLNSSKKTPLCELKGYGNTCDAYHQTASSPSGEGAWRAMKKALDTSGLGREDIDYINAHGTGTVNNDLSEGLAIERLFSPDIPPVSSTKSLTGHTLGAAGGIEAVLSILAIKNRILLPNVGFGKKMKQLRFAPNVQSRRDVKLKNVLTNSFGFGGNNTSLIFSRC